jgi:hypothetical protein
MARVLFTREQYDLCVEAFREQSGNASHAGRKAGCTPHTARRAWRLGWPDRGWLPIKDLVANEQEAARAARQKSMADMEAETAQRARDAQAIQTDSLTSQLEKEIADREKAREDAIKTRAEEAQMIRGLRGDVGMMLAIIGQGLRGGLDSGKRIRKALETGMDKNGQVLSLKEEVELSIGLAKFSAVAIKGVKVAIEAERLLMGEPTEILGLTMNQLTDEDAVHVLEVGQRAVERTRERFELIKGGADESEAESA